MVIDCWYNFGKLAYARTPTGNYYALFDNRLAFCYAAIDIVLVMIGIWYRCPFYGVLLHRRSLNHKTNCKLVQQVCTDITRLWECMHRFRVGHPNIILRATNTHISDQMRSPKMIFGSIWRLGDRPFPALGWWHAEVYCISYYLNLLLVLIKCRTKNIQSYFSFQ